MSKTKTLFLFVVFIKSFKKMYQALLTLIEQRLHSIDEPFLEDVE